MKIEFRRSFLKDLKAVTDRRVLDRVKQRIADVEQAELLSAISNVKKLRSSGEFDRIRVGDYRLGLAVETKL